MTLTGRLQYLDRLKVQSQSQHMARDPYTLLQQTRLRRQTSQLGVLSLLTDAISSRCRNVGPEHDHPFVATTCTGSKTVERLPMKLPFAQAWAVLCYTCHSNLHVHFQAGPLRSLPLSHERTWHDANLRANGIRRGRCYASPGCRESRTTHRKNETSLTAHIRNIRGT